MEKLKSLAEKMTRKKKLNKDILNTRLDKCLSLFDLISFGLSNMIGAGIYVITGDIARNIAGPGIVVSYLFGAVTAFLSSLCYAEFGAQVPKTGSAYTYTYITIGEFPAFLIGWNMVLDIIIGTASTAKALSGTLINLASHLKTNNTVEQTNSELENPSWLEDKPDFLAFGCILVIAIVIGAGAKITAFFNNILTSMNIFVLVFIISVSMYYANITNWTNKTIGGFLPYGFSGVIAGSASCFYSYSGFESIASASEEAKNVKRNIPLSFVVSILITTILYVGASSSLTLMIPYNRISVITPFPDAFKYNGCEWASIFISLGGLLALTANTTCSLYSLPRTAYAMADDGLLFRGLAYIYPKTQIPLVSLCVFALLSALSALLIKLKTLIELMSIGTLLCYTAVSVNVIILRYQTVQLKLNHTEDSSNNSQNTDNIFRQVPEYQNSQERSQDGDEEKDLENSKFSISILKCLPIKNILPITLSLMIIFSSFSWLIIFNLYNLIFEQKIWWVILILVMCLSGFMISFLLLWVHDKNRNYDTFQMPLVPYFPVLSIVLNIGLMLKLNFFTWIRLLVWLSIGIPIYFIHGIQNSNENTPSTTYQIISSNSEENLVNNDETSFENDKNKE